MREFIQLFESQLIRLDELFDNGTLQLGEWAAGRGSLEKALEKAVEEYGIKGMQCAPRQFVLELEGKTAFVKSYQVGQKYEIKVEPGERVLTGWLTFVPQTKEILVQTVMPGVTPNEPIYDAKKWGGNPPIEVVMVYARDFGAGRDE